MSLRLVSIYQTRQGVEKNLYSIIFRNPNEKKRIKSTRAKDKFQPLNVFVNVKINNCVMLGLEDLPLKQRED